MDRAHEPLGPLLSRATRQSKGTTRSARERTSRGAKTATARRPPDLELEAGARAHFEDPIYYAESYEHRSEDARYYLGLAEPRGSVLEHGIGNGRIALPLARAGVEVAGIDHCRPMLDHLRELLEREPRAVQRRVKLHEGDIRTARIGGQFPLVICPFNAALHLYTREDVEEWLARVREQLLPGGELVFDISMPVLEDLTRDPSKPYRVPSFQHPTAGRVSYREYFDYDRVRQILFVSMLFRRLPERAGGPRTRTTSATRPSGEFMTPLAHRQFFPREMEALLHYNGFEVTELYGDFERGPLVQRSDVMVWHARPRSARRTKRGTTS